jgi:RNA polymerase sigma-70 factor, ECF subfamily
VSRIGAELIALLPRLRRYALKVSRSPEAADDLVQAACERALTGAEKAEGAPFDVWMFCIMRNLHIDGLRRQKTRGETVDVDEHAEVAGEDGRRVTESRLMLDRVSRAIDGLPEEFRDVMLLVCVEEFSYREAAEILGIPIGTVMSRLARARLRLAEAMGMDGRDEGISAGVRA